jgi:hypothetical protein
MAEQLPGHEVDRSDPMKAMVTMVRVFLRDWAPLNELIEGEESSDRDIYLAIFRCIEDFNGTSPITGYTLADLLSLRQYDLILQGSACNIIQSVYLPRLRNEVQFTDAGISANIQGKHRDYLQWYQMTKNEYEQKKRNAKIALNQAGLLDESGGLSGVPSEFWDLYNFYEDLI